MKPPILTTAWLVLALAAHPPAQLKAESTQQEAVAAINKLGCSVTINANRPRKAAALADEKPAKQKPPPLAKRSLGKLAKLLVTAPHESDDESVFDEQSILVELIRRGGKEVEKLLVRRLKDHHARRRAEIMRLKKIPKRDEDARFEQEDKVRDASRNLHLLTALRRVQGKSDPLVVHVFKPEELKATTRRLPMVDVALRLSGKTAVWIERGGLSTSGRKTEWWIEVRDARGKLVANRETGLSLILGGGQLVRDGQWTTRNFLKYGRQLRTTLNMTRYVRIPTPGNYTVRFHYHNGGGIGHTDDPVELKKHIIYSSKAFRFKVTRHPKRVIQLKSGERKRAEALIAALNADAKLKVVRGRYDKSVHKFLSPKSPPGQLLTMGWQATPVLLEMLADKRTSMRKRAWILSLLSTISGEEDFDPLGDSVPFGSKILPDYDTQPVAEFFPFGRSISGGGGSGADFKGLMDLIKKQPVDRKAQQKFIDRWFKFQRDYLDIREAPRRKDGA